MSGGSPTTCPRPAGDREPGDLADQRLHIGGGCHHRQGAVNLEPELRHRPCGVRLLDSPMAILAARAFARSSSTGIARRVHGSACSCAPRQAPALLRAPSALPTRPAVARRWALPPGSARRRCAVPRPWCAGCSAPPAGQAARWSVCSAASRAFPAQCRIICLSSGVSALDLDEKQVHDLLADPADLGAVAVGPRHHGVAGRGQPRAPAIRSVTGATASRWLCRLRESSVRHFSLVGLVGPSRTRFLHGHVHMQMRVAVSRLMLCRNRLATVPATVPPLPRPG